MTRKHGKTPTGVTLDQLAAGFKRQGLEIPDHIKSLMEEHAPKKKVGVKTAKEAYDKANAAYDQANTANTVATEAIKVANTAAVVANTVSANTDTHQTITKPAEKNPQPTQPEQVQDAAPEKKPNKHTIKKAARGVLVGFLGKNFASKLIKKPIVRSEPEHFRPDHTNSDVKEIKADIEEIRAYLKNNGKKELHRDIRSRSKASKFTSGFIRGAFGGGDKAQKLDSFLTDREPKAEKTQKPTEHAGPTVQRIPASLAPIEADRQYQEAASAGKDDQEKVAHVKEDDAEKAKSKTVHSKLDRILEILDKIKRKGSGSGLGIAALLAGMLGKIKEALGAGVTRVFGYIKKIGEWIAKKFMTAFSFLKKAGGWLGRARGTALRAVGGVGLLAATGAAAITAGGIAGLNKIADYEFKRAATPFEGLDQKYGLKALGNGKFNLQGKTYSYNELPEDYKRLVGSVVDPRGGSAQRDQEYIKQNADHFKKLEIQQRAAEPLPAPSAPVPVPKQAPQRLAQASAQNTEMKSAQQSETRVIMVKGSDKTVVVPQTNQVSPSVSVSPRNPERSYDSLVSGMFDNPAGYSGLSRM